MKACSKTDLNEIVEEVIGDIELAILEKKANIEVDNLPVIDAVPGQMRQIFQNILTNALKFSKEGVAPHVQIRCVTIDSAKLEGAKETKDGNYCRISIKDNGIGFDPQYAAKVFTIFQRLHPREKFEGTGIGLAIAKKIIEKHNGIIGAYSKEGEGAEFVMVLPIRQQPQDQ